jgi:hypothetical protein
MILRDFDGNPEAQYWLVRHRIRKEFGLSATEADDELDNRPEEVIIHLKILELMSKREKREIEKSKMRQNIRG